MIHKEMIVDGKHFDKVVKGLLSVKEFVDSELARLDKIAKSNEPLGEKEYLVLNGEIFALQKLMYYSLPRMCDHEDIEFGDIEEQAECQTCHATCDWCRESRFDEDTGQEIVENIVGEWHLPTMEECHERVAKELGIKG